MWGRFAPTKRVVSSGNPQDPISFSERETPIEDANKKKDHYLFIVISPTLHTTKPVSSNVVSLLTVCSKKQERKFVIVFLILQGHPKITDPF